MAAAILYDIEFTNTEETFVKVTIADNSVQTDETPQVIKLTGGDTPVRVGTIDEEENKFTPIKSQQAIITFLSDDQYSLKTFADGPDDRFSVTVVYGTSIIFYGFLSLNDNSELFVSGRNEVTLVANDKLAALKDIPLTDAGENPQGKYTIAELVAMCLKKTGLELELRVINNLKHGSGQLTALATFTSSPNQFITAITSFFYPGQKVTITGTASNNITFTVSDVGQGIVTIVASDDAFIDETEISATFTDITGDGHFYDTTYLDAKTFEEEIGTCEDCYTVLEKILGYDSFLVQYKERWWICRVDEFDNNELYVAKFSADGLYDSIYTESNLSKNIGFNEDHYFSEERTRVSPTRPLWFVKLIYNFDNPLEIICNQDFDRGDFIEDLADEVNEDGVTQNVKSYEAECWESLSKEGGQPNQLLYYDQAPLGSASIYVKKFFFNDAETYRELIIEAPPGSGAGLAYIKSQAVRVQSRDKIQFSFDLKYTNTGGSTAYLNTPAMVGLYADSGNIYWWKAYDVTNPEAPQEWELITTSSLVPNWYLGASLDKDWNLSHTSPPVPETGNLFVYLINQYGSSVEAHYSGVQMDVLPFINGSYKSYKGRHHKVQRAETGYLAVLEEEVYISDAERELFKGAMFWLDGSTYKLTRKWYDASKTALGYPTDLTNVRPFGELQAYAVWNQYRLSNTVFEYSIQGLGDDIPSLPHKYSVTDVSTLSNNRKYLMMTKDMDLKRCTVVGVIEQSYNTEEGKVYTDEHEFKYIS